jgi:recombination protein RecR
MKLSSKLLQDAVDALAMLPSIGKKSALRLVLHLVENDSKFSDDIIESLKNLKEIKHCKQCCNLSDHEICSICLDESREKGVLCIVENIKDVMAVEETSRFNGLYHVLGGVISPIDGVGPKDLFIHELFERIDREQIKEVIMAISPTIDGETTIYYLAKRLQEREIKVSTISRGVAFGGELSYTDELTLGRSIMDRIPYTIAQNP